MVAEVEALNPYRIFIVVALLGAYLLERVAAVLNARNASIEVPAEFLGICDPDRYRRSQEYLRSNLRFALWSGTGSTAAVLAFFLLGGFAWVDGLARSIGWGSIPTGLVFAGILALGSDLLSVPFALYRVFGIEARYGFNRSTLRTFVLDRLKTWLLAAVLGSLAGSLVLWLFEAAGSTAWLLCWAAVTVLSLAVSFIAPVWILPLFNRFTPLPDGELRQAIEALCRQQGFGLRGVFTMDGSRRSSKANAFLVGFGRTKRIALYDTLVAKHPPGEIVAILAHEIGHCRCRHVAKQLLLSAVILGVVFFLLSRFINHPELFEAFGVQQPSVYASLVFFGFLWTPLGILLGLAGNGLSRRFEREADAFAARAAGNPGPFISALKRLSVDSLANLTPHPLTVLLHYSHPPVLERIRSLSTSAARCSAGPTGPG